jgi:hypothetical protein
MKTQFDDTLKVNITRRTSKSSTRANSKTGHIRRGFITFCSLDQILRRQSVDVLFVERLAKARIIEFTLGGKNKTAYRTARFYVPLCAKDKEVIALVSSWFVGLDVAKKFSVVLIEI